MRKVGVIGLGKLGLPMLCAFIQRNFNVKGYDINVDLLNNLIIKHIESKEIGVKETILADTNWDNRIVQSIQDIFNHSEMIFVIVPTPSLPDGNFDRSYIHSILDQLNNLAKHNNVIKDVTITSTLNPYDCDYFQKMFNHLNIFYSPEFIALGSVINDMLNPDVCLIGCTYETHSNRLIDVYKQFYIKQPKYSVLSFVEAELAKISINSYITMKITFANMIGSYLHNVTNGNLNKISRTLLAIGTDSRINNKYFRFGTGYGGTCFPRDNRCLSYNLSKNYINVELPKTTDNVNDWLLDFFSSKIKINEYSNIVYVGLSYKDGSDCTEESFILKLHDKLLKHNKNFYFIDDKIDEYNGIEKITSTRLLPVNNTLYLINYCNEEVKKALYNCNTFNFWA